MTDEDVALEAAGDELRQVDGAGAPDDGPGFEEIEHEGQVYQVPSGLRGALMMRADYDRQVQDLDGHRQALAAERQAHAAEVEASHANMADRARLHLLDEQIAAFEQMDWTAAGSANPDQAQALWTQYQAAREARARYAWSLTHQAHQSQVQAEREAAARLVETGQVLAKTIEGWSPQVASDLVKYAADFGVSLDELREIADPRLWQILHRAHQGDQSARRQAEVERLTQAQKVKPAVSVRGRTGAGAGVTAGDDLAMSEWMRRRGDQTRRR